METLTALAPLITSAPLEDDDVRPDVAWLADEGAPGTEPAPEEPDAFDAYVWGALLTV
jgi:hypothetical protein